MKQDRLATPQTVCKWICVTRPSIEAILIAFQYDRFGMLQTSDPSNHVTIIFKILNEKNNKQK